MKKKRTWIIIGVVLLLAAAGVVAAPRVMASLNGPTTTTYETQPAEVGSLTAFVGATGTVRSNQTARLVWQAAGQVGEVLVQKGQQVAGDTVLAELERTSLSQNIILAESDLVSAQNALEETLDNSEARAAAQLALIAAEKALEDAEKESQSKLYQRASENTIDIARANLIMANEALDEAEAVFEQVQGRGEEDPVYAAALSGYASARQEQQKADYNLRYVQGLPDPLDVEEVYAKLEQAQVQLLKAREEWERIKDGPDPDDIANAEARVAAAQATLNMVKLTAPFAGTITSVSAKQGDMVTAGTVGFQIDDLSRLLVDVQVSEIDINRVRVGQPVSLTFDAIAEQEYLGKVTDIATTGSNEGGAVNFMVTVELANPGAEIRPGMTAAVNVAVSQLDNVLLAPSRAVRVVDGQRVVYVLRDGLPVAVAVELGASDNSRVQILSGDVQAGDQIILNPPSQPLRMGQMRGPAGGQ